MDDGLDGREREIARAHDDLIERGVLVPVGDDEDQVAWSDCDLASLAENRLGELPPAEGLDDELRDDWAERAMTERLLPPSERRHERCAWLVDGAERVGTVALATSAFGGRRVRVSSLYMSPQHRGRGLARRGLDRIRDALGAHGLGLRLETCWTWQRTLRFYLAYGMWVRMWKRDVDLWCEAGVPSPRVAIGERTAELTVDLGAERVVLVRAAREGDRLVSFVDPARRPEHRDERLAPFAWDASSTLAVVLATEGWPLVASPETWRRGWHGDAGNPEGLADRIACWEAWENERGWRVETPRIPGLVYPTWAELEAEWSAPEPAK